MTERSSRQGRRATARHLCAVGDDAILAGKTTSLETMTQDEMKKVQMVMDTQNSCWEQNMPKEYDEGEMDKEGEESHPKKKNK